MESPKYTHEDKQWANELVKKLGAEFPDANMRQDAEYFIYDLKTRNGAPVEGRTPKWESVPLKQEDGVVPVATEKVIRAELQFRHLYGLDDYHLPDILRRAGVLP
jgi:hypothetical protein